MKWLWMRASCPARRYSTPHMGAPYLGEEAIVNLAYLLLLSTENDGLVMSTAPR